MAESPSPTERRPQLPTAGGDPGRRRWVPRARWSLVLVALLVLNWGLVNVFAPPEPVPTVPYQPFFLDQVDAGNVKRINTQGEAVTGEFRTPTRYPPKAEKAAKEFRTQFPSFADREELSQRLEAGKVEISAAPIAVGRGLLFSVLIGFGPVVLLVGLLIYFTKKGPGGAGAALGNFARSRARRVDTAEQGITFEDVAGIEESKAELTEVVDFLRNPERYQKLGGRIPRGVLLAGQPGTGKTLLARAVAGEAGVPFFSSSASEFVEAIVGVGAARVRDLFKQAKEAAPAIIFIDELDAVGRSRSGGAAFGSGSNDEREQTLNQILTEMDGFGSDATVIVLGATNRPEVLDSALLRPGRFDRRVTVPAPDLEGRRKILVVHTRSVPLDDDVDLERLAASTPGMVGADLANLCNEAALLAARRRNERVRHADFTDAFEKIILGAPRQMVLSEADRRRTAFHEAGHAIVGMLTEGADPVRKVSIIPRGMALGVTLSTPDADRVNYDVQTLLARIDVGVAGRIAEELVFGTITTGASNDIEQVTRVARAMVGRWGMSDRIGFVNVTPEDPAPFGTDGASEETRRIVDLEVKQISDASQQRVRALLTEHRERLDALAGALLDRETLDQDEAYEVAGIDPARAPGSAPASVSLPSR